MPTLTVRNVPEDAKHRFRQVAAAHGRSMEEHLRQLVIEADFGDAGPRPSRVADTRQTFRHEISKENWVRELVNKAAGYEHDDEDYFSRGKFADIRFMSAKDAMAELRRLANGVGFDLPPRFDTPLEAPDFLILVDTNVWSELAKPVGDPAVLAWLEANDRELALSTLVMAEIQYGLELPKAAHKRNDLTLWLRGLEERYWTNVWVFDADDARSFGRLAASTEVKKRDPQMIDLQLAAQALAREATIATRNVKDFEWTGAKVIDPWTA